MSQQTRRYMRLIVMFDLPVTTKEARKAYTQFRKFLLNDGYDMVQFSVYGRILHGEDDAEKHIKRLALHLPSSGSVRYMKITEKQFSSMGIAVGQRKFQEKMVNNQQVLLF